MKLNKGEMNLFCAVIRAYKRITASQWDRSRTSGYEEKRGRNPRAPAMW